MNHTVTARPPPDPNARVTDLPSPRRPGIRRQLLRLVGGVIVVSGIALALTLVSLRVEALSSSEHLTESLAHIIAEQTSATFQAIQLGLEIASGHVERAVEEGRLDEPTGRELLRAEVQKLPFVRALSVADASGKVLWSSDAAAPGWSVGDRAYFQVYREKPDTGFFIGVPVRGQLSGVWLISATWPLRSADGALAGILIAAVEPAFFDRLWSAVDVGAGGSIALFRHDGLLMLRTPFDGAAAGKTFGDLPWARGWNSGKKHGSFTDKSPIDGAFRMLSYRTLSANQDLIVLVGRSYDLVLAPWRQLATIALSIWAIACLSVVLLGVSLNKSWHHVTLSEASADQMAQRLALATDAASVGVWDWDLKADSWYATPTYFSMLGYAPDQGIGPRQQWLNLVHPDDKDLVAANIRAALDGAEAPYRHDARLLHGDGSFHWMSVAGRVLARGENGKPSRLLGVMTDITERKRVEQALRESEALNLSILDSVIVEIAVLDRDGTIIAVNEPWKRFALENQVEPDRAGAHAGIGSNYLAACRLDGAMSEDAANAVEGIRAVLDGSLPFFKLDYPCPSPTEARWFTMNASPLQPDRRGVVVAHVDVTQRKLADEALRTTVREKDALLKEVHHRVKNNLQVITSLLRLESTRTREPGTRDVLKDMQGRIRSMALLHETLYRTGKFARVDLADYLRQLANHLFRAQNTSGSLVRLELNLASVVVDIDQAIPCGLLVNELLTNSLKHAFGEGGGELRVLLRPDVDGQAHLEVSDTGRGLPPNFEERRGASLGLQLVSDLARQIGGTLVVGPGVVPRFLVIFPLRHLETETIVLKAG